MAVATFSGGRLMLMPSASSTSALPDLDETERPPCLATRAPAPAATKVAAVEMLKVCAESPPVPQVSTRCALSATGTLVESSRITIAAAVISPMVSFFTRRPVISAAISTGLTSPAMIWRISDSISSWKISRCSIRRSSASWGFIQRVSVKKFFSSAWPCSVSTDSGWNCTPSTASVLWRTPMISPSSVQAVISRQSGRLSRSITSEW